MKRQASLLTLESCGETFPSKESIHSYMLTLDSPDYKTRVPCISKDSSLNSLLGSSGDSVCVYFVALSKYVSVCCIYFNKI